MSSALKTTAGQTDLVEGLDLASRLAMRSVTINGRRTTMRLEPSMWRALRRIAEDNSVSVNQLCSQIDSQRGELSMTAAVRSYIVSYLQQGSLGQADAGEESSANGLLAKLGPAYAKGEMMRVRFDRGDESLTKISLHLAVLERGEAGALSDLYREWRRRRDQLQALPRITELSARLLRRLSNETMMNVVDLSVGGSLAQPHQDPVMSWTGAPGSHRPHPLLRAAFQQDMIAVENQAEPMYQVVEVGLAQNLRAYKRLLLPLSDDGTDVTRVVVAALPVGEDMEENAIA